MRVSRPHMNLAIDLLAFVLAIGIVATGFVLEYTLPPGSGRIGTEGFDAPTGSLSWQRPIVLLWGMSRPEWSQIHFWLAIALMAVLSLHVIVHWKWVVAMVKGRPLEGSGIRVAVSVLCLLGLLALALAPFWSSTTRVPRGRLLEQRQHSLQPRQAGSAD